MRPIEHFVVAVVPIVGCVLVRNREFPHSRLVLVVFFGSQFPDLVDKPLAHVLFVIPSGRVFIHSVPFAAPLSLLVIGYARHTNRLQMGGGFVFAYLSHLVADNYRALTGADAHIPPDLLWPFVSPIPRPPVPYWAGPNSIHLHLWSLFSIVTLALVAYVVVLDIRATLTLRTHQ